MYIRYDKQADKVFLNLSVSLCIYIRVSLKTNKQGKLTDTEY